MIRLALTTAIALCVAVPTLAQSADQRLAQMRERVERLEDQNAIELLQATYGYYFDKGMWPEVAQLFTRQGRFEYGQRGVYIGQQRIERALLLFGPEPLAPGHLNNHMQLQAVITVAPGGQTATGRFQGMMMLGERGANGVWGVGIYENRYVKEGGTWRISSLHFYPTGMTDYDAGWMRSALPMEGPSALFPPDEPPTVVYRSFPQNYIPEFSYPHPVTGQPITVVQPRDDIAGRE
ncbi:nuclear transport factor 2 family protein [Altererythrobacter sp. KTW20L]|uniref:nuclear transport factor 2 family protein n=1 Tax=Altererythrobacter sp. KTW20L TaxID=2942210 RepID=UPI0020C0F906|nr:nuclear transport factor 2 family protein [Altererythrobacter sp. KTW20L]MCL6251506.1 nuclear transport factor 2 family protein [Altererythrobacter sp. KTW20L]